VTRAVHTGAHQNGAGSILAVAIIGTVIVAVMLMLPFYCALTLRQAVTGAADGAALAAADVAVGIEPGIPCEVAAAVAAANGARLASCELDGLIATVSTARSFLGLPMSATARAGPPR
jgi:secretion/DNA translocation related TadE-like protein